MKYFTVGPSHLYPTVHQHVQTALQNDILSLSHRSDTFMQLFKKTSESIKRLLNIPDDYSIFFLSSATECWERILENTVENKSFHIVNGAFSKKFYEASLNYGKNAISYEFDGVNWQTPEISLDTELIAITQNETSNGIQIPMKFISEIKAKHPKSLIALDVVSSIPYVNVDYSMIDMTFFSVQKGFGLPAGLALLIVSPHALQKEADLAKKSLPMTTYRRFSQMKKYAEKFQTFETPNVFYIYLFSKVVEDMLKKGINKIRKETEEKSQMFDDFFKNSQKFSIPHKHPDCISKTVIVADVKDGTAELLKNLKTKGYTVGAGYEALKDKQIRIANFPAFSKEDIQKLITLLKTI